MRLDAQSGAFLLRDEQEVSADAAKNVLKSSGLDLEKRNADGRWILPVLGTFVIDRSGYIVYANVDADYRNRPEPREIAAMCRSLRR
jgi:peroxiredoxin